MKVRAASERDISPRFFKSLVFYGTFKTAPFQEVIDPSRNKNNSLTISREQDWIKTRDSGWFRGDWHDAITLLTHEHQKQNK